MVQKSCKPENRLLKNDDLAMQYVHCDFDKARCRAHWGEGIRLEGIRESPEVMMVIQFSGTVPLHNSDVVSSGYLQGMVMMRKEMAKNTLTPRQAWLILISNGTRSLTTPWAILESTGPSTQCLPQILHGRACFGSKSKAHEEGTKKKLLQRGVEPRSRRIRPGTNLVWNGNDEFYP